MAVTPDVLMRELAGLRALAQSLVHGDADADDLLQETAMAAMAHPPAVDDERPARPWLAKVLRNRWRMDRRTRSRREAREHVVQASSTRDATDAGDAIDRARVLEKLAGALVALDEPFRTVVVRRYIDGESAADIARSLGVPDGTVRWRLKTGLDRLRAALDEKSPRWQRALAPILVVKGTSLFPVAAKGAVVVKTKSLVIPIVVALLLLGGGGFAVYKLRESSPVTPPVATTPSKGSAAKTKAIVVEPAGSAASTSPPEQPPVPGQGRVTVETVVAAGGVVSGRVINWSTGEAVGGAEVTFTSTAGATTLHTDKNGAFELAPAASGTFELTTIVAPSFLPYAPELEHSPVRIALAPNQAVRGLVLFLQPALDYYGKVVDGKGAPVADAHVKMTDPPSGEQSLEKIKNEWTTDKQGAFVFHAQDFTVLEATRGTQRGWAVVDGNVQTTKNLTIKIGDAAARDATIKGKVVDTSGSPIPDVLVTALPDDKPGDQTPPRSVAFATSGDDGSFTLQGLDRKTYTLLGEDEDHAQARIEKIAGGAQNVAIKLDAGLPLGGVVRDSDDKPISSYTLLVTRRQGLIRDIVTTRSVVDARGTFAIRVPKGSYELLAYAAGWAPSAPLPVEAGTTDAKIRLAAGATLTGQVVDAKTGAPLPYARIQREGASGGATASPANAGVVTRDDGTFELTGIPAGPFTVSIGAGDYNPRLEGGLVAQDGQTIGPLKLALNKLAEGQEPKIELVGIGVKLSADGEELKVELVVPESGAAAAGIVAGDHIAAIDGVPVTQLGMDGSVSRIRGVAHTTLSVGVDRGGKMQTLVVERKPFAL